MKNYLEKAGLRKTKPRLAVLDLLQSSPKPRTAQDIHRETKGICDQATIYRVLESFKDAGFVFEETRDGIGYFYLGKKKHHHITCRNCKKTQCIPCNHVFASISGFAKVEHELTLSGVCEMCK